MTRLVICVGLDKAHSHGSGGWPDGFMTQDLEQERKELWDSLAQSPRQISSKWFYDALGSALFDAITRLPEYYPTNCELSLLSDPSLDSWSALPRDAAVVELGSGNAEKIMCLLQHLNAPRSYHPIDVSDAALKSTLEPVNAAYPKLATKALHGDFCDSVALENLLKSVHADAPVIVFFPGSTIGNFPLSFAQSILSAASRGCPAGSVLLLGMDLIKDPAQLIPAYDDAVGLTAAFNRNALGHLNRALGTTFEVASWRHEARFNPEHKRIEMWLVCGQAQRVEVGNQTLEFAVGDEIRTECSHKYDEAQIQKLIAGTGWTLDRITPDASERFAQVLLKVKS